MTQLDTTLRATASSLVAKFGKAMTLHRVTEGTYDPATGNAAPTETSVAITGVITAPSPYMIANGVMGAGDLVVTVAASDVDPVPDPGDELIVDAATWRVLAVRVLYSGAQPAVYELHARS